VLVPPITEDDHSPLPEWMIMSDTKVVKYVDAPHFKVPQGRYAVELVAGRETALVQEVRTTPGMSYKMCFSVGDAGNRCQGSMFVEAYAAQGKLQVRTSRSARAGTGAQSSSSRPSKMSRAWCSRA
jgi:hypothetical protein